MTHTITLPSSAFLGNFERFTSPNTFPIDNTPLTLTSSSSITSLHPVISAMLAPLVHTHSNLLIPTTSIHNSHKLDSFLESTLPAYNLNDTDTLITKYVLAELTRNTSEHATTTHNATVAIAYSHKSRTLRIGIADQGVGIPTSLRRLYPELDDYHTILTALTPGITGTTKFPGGSTQNAGAGLFFVKSLAHQLGSHFLIYSGTGLFKLLKRKTKRNILQSDARKDHASGSNNFPHWQGTAIGFDLPLNRLADFNQALTQIRQAYTNHIRGKQKTPSQTAEFI